MLKYRRLCAKNVEIGVDTMHYVGRDFVAIRATLGIYIDIIQLFIIESSYVDIIHSFLRGIREHFTTNGKPYY